MKPDFYCLVVGTRTFSDSRLLAAYLDRVLDTGKYNIHIVSGGAKGADALVKAYALKKGYEYHEFTADWNAYGKSAGYIRNERMHQFIAQYEHRGCVCFWDGRSKGTAHSFELAGKYKTSLKICRYTKEEPEGIR